MVATLFYANFGILARPSALPPSINSSGAARHYIEGILAKLITLRFTSCCTGDESGLASAALHEQFVRNSWGTRLRSKTSATRVSKPSTSRHLSHRPEPHSSNSKSGRQIGCLTYIRMINHQEFGSHAARTQRDIAGSKRCLFVAQSGHQGVSGHRPEC